MYDANLLSSDALTWVMDNAQNELVAYLCEVDFREMYGNEWPRMARDQATLCRAVAASAREPNTKESWLDLARQYEETAESE